LAVSPKGGSGKTTTAINLTVFAVHDGLNVALLDTDRQRSATRWHELRPLDAPVIHLVSVPLDRIAEAFRQIETMPELDLVIVDTPTAVEYLPDQTLALIQRADAILVPSTAGKPDVDSVIGWMALLKRQQANAAFVINRANSRATQPRRRNDADEPGDPVTGSVAFRAAQKRLNKAGFLCPFPVRQLESIQATHEVGVGIKEIAGAKGTEDFEALWDFTRNMLRL